MAKKTRGVITVSLLMHNKKNNKKKTMYKLQHRVKLPDGRLKYIICRHINITVQTIYLYALILSMSVIYNCKNNPFQRYLLHVVDYVLNVVEHGVYITNIYFLM